MALTSETKIAHRLARHQRSLLLLVALTLFYLAWSPGTIEGQGYNKENIDAATALADNVINAVRGRPVLPLVWTRHGGLEVLFELPLALLARLLTNAPRWPGALLSLLPIVCTALLATILFVWAESLCGSRRTALWLTLGAAVGTMLWPYAYIGLETSQSLFLLCAAWQSLGRRRTYGWSEIVVLALACALAVAVKLNGVFLLPAVAFLLCAYFWEARGQFNSPQLSLRLLVAGLLIAVVFGWNYHVKSRFWAQSLGEDSVNYFRDAMIGGIFDWAVHFTGFFITPNKSLFVYAPLLLPCVLALPAAWRAHARLTIFALLVLLGLAGGFALVSVWTEETWGPRYLHSSIAPLVLCWAAALKAEARNAEQKARGLSRKAQAWLRTTVAIGVLVSLLGTLFYYGRLMTAATRARQNTLEALQYDPAWQHVRFNALLLDSWARALDTGQAASLLWPPAPRWWFAPPAGVTAARPVEIGDLAVPAPLLLRPWWPGVGVSPPIYQLMRVGAGLLLLTSWLLLVRLSRACRLADCGDARLANTESLSLQQPA